MALVFIDGQAGSTGLEVHERLAARSDIDLLHIDPERRKEPSARAECLARADISILCLPDNAAREAVTLIEDRDVRLIDASSAHRTSEGWVYGFPELAPGQRSRITTARRISNPGCYATGAIAIIAPLVRSGLIQPGQPLTVHAVSGYSGGGKALIAEFGSDESGAPSSRLYGLDLRHKHIPEIMYHCGLEERPAFSPMVGKFRRGMVVCLPLHPRRLATALHLADIRDALTSAYEGETMIEVADTNGTVSLLDPEELAGCDCMRLQLFGDDECAMICASLDNLGKGAAGAAIQNLNLALGVPEYRSLRREKH